MPAGDYSTTPPDASTGESSPPASRPDWWPAALAPVLAAATAVLGRLWALGGWWNQDDWGLLARAAGMAAEGSAPVRWLSQDLYWRLLHPLAGLDPSPYAVTRLLLHAGAAALTTRIAARAGLGPPAQLLAGLLVAATPLAFTPLYWAAGVQELMAAVLLLAALERWLAGGRAGVAAAAVFGAASMLAKEPALALPAVLAAGTLLLGPPPRADRAAAWAAVAFLTAAAAAEALLVLAHFGTDPGQPYALGNALTAAGNLGAYGGWLVWPGARFVYRNAPAPLLAGLAVWVVWAAWGVMRWRRGRPLALSAWALALAALAPALVLRHHAYPYLAYPAAPALALAIADLLPRGWRPRPGVAFMAAAAIGLAAFALMTARVKARDETGRPADPLVLRTAVSAEASRTLRRYAASPAVRDAPLVLLVPPAGPAEAAGAERLGGGAVPPRLLPVVLDGATGPALLLGEPRRARWASDLLQAPTGAHVLVEAGERLLPWGPLRQALLYATLTDVARGLHERARRHLLRAALMDGGDLPFIHDPDLLLEPPSRVLARKDAFLAHLAASEGAGDASRAAGLQQIFLDLLGIVTGRSPEDLAADSGR
ncbi:MAG: hypothetical protein R6X25_09490 [Candidatus Krumholzibacteriia bacterium]